MQQKLLAVVFEKLTWLAGRLALSRRSHNGRHQGGCGENLYELPVID
jgi:hypothetical protein